MITTKEKKKAINHIAIIMDGNRRWARAKGLPILKGHEQGYVKMKEVGRWCQDRGIKAVTIYAFSTENLKRSKEEVNYLFQLLKKAVQEELNHFNGQGIKLNIIGRWKDLPRDLATACREAMEKTAHNTKGVLNIAINYTGRNEIVDAVQKAMKENGEIHTDADITNFLETNGSGDPDLLIRTSGEQRLSGFLLWQLAYAELYFTPTLWPDFSERDLDAALDWYYSRNRRFGA